MKALLAGGAAWLLPLALFPQLTYLPGWPVPANGPATSSITIADLDDDGTNELVYGDYSYLGQNDWWLYVKAPDGNDKPGWPINFAGCATSPVLADLDDDGTVEIIKPCGGLKVWNADGTLRWQYPNPAGIVLANASVADLDNDGNLEIVVTCTSGGAVFVFDAQGNVRPGWPVLAFLGGLQSASIGDIDGDGLKEIIHTSADLWCFKSDGSYCAGFPIDYPFSSHSKPVLADIDGDGKLEIIFGWDDQNLRILRGDGTYYPGYPFTRYATGIALGDVNRDSNYDMTLGWGSLYSYDISSASLLPNFPITDTAGGFSLSAASPNLVDLSGTPGIEIATGAACCGFVPDGKLYAYDINGQMVSGFPSGLLYHRALSRGCSVNDVDGSGTTDICCGSENAEFGTPISSTVYCWATGYPYNLDNVDWAMDGFDLGHTGRWRRLYHINKVLSPLSLVPCQGQGNPCYLPPDGSLIAVDVTAIRQFGGANPAGQDVRYSRTLGCGNYEGPVIDHGDGTYTRMLRAPLAACTTDVHAWVNEFKLQDYQRIVFTTGCVGPPPPFSLLSPANHAPNQPLSVTLDWTEAGTAPNPNRAVTYDLYFGPTPTPPLYASGLPAIQQAVSGLAMNATYFWKVVAKNACGTTSSALWAFTTIPCTIPPRPFVNLSPPNGAVNQPLTVDLTWQASTQASSYQVYLGTAPGDLALVSTVSGTRYAASGLCASTTYYWQIIARNACGNRQGAVWSFTTGTDAECRHCRPVSPP